MFKISTTIAAVSLLAATAAIGVPTDASAFPALQPSIGANAPLPVEKTAYFYGGREYCFYPNGWRGPGYYLCGFPQRRGFFFAPGFSGFGGGRAGGGHFGGGHGGGAHFGGARVGGGHAGGGHVGGGHMGGHGGGHGGGHHR